MPRVARVAIENSFYHIFHKGAGNQAVFIEEADFDRFLDKLEGLKTVKGFDHSILSYSLLPSQFHLLIYVHKTPLSKIMTSLLTGYSMYWNSKYKRKGSVFHGRFRSKVVDPQSYFIDASCYIHALPSYFGLSEDPSLYPFSSFGEILGISHQRIVNKEEVMGYIGDSPWALEEYKKRVLKTVDLVPTLKKKFSFAKQIEGGEKVQHVAEKQLQKEKVRHRVEGFLKRYLKK